MRVLEMTWHSEFWIGLIGPASALCCWSCCSPCCGCGGTESAIKNATGNQTASDHSSVMYVTKKMGTVPGVGRCPAVSSEDVMGVCESDWRYNGRQSRLFPLKTSPENKKAPDTTVGIWREMRRRRAEAKS